MLRILVSDGDTLDRMRRGNPLANRRLGLASTIAMLNKEHSNNRVYVSLFESDPEAMTRYEKSVSNIKEVKARDGIVISIVTNGDHLAREASDHIIELPPAPELLVPLLEIIPLQLLAYHIAVRLGCDVDQPRNLAKSVTVE